MDNQQTAKTIMTQNYRYANERGFEIFYVEKNCPDSEFSTVIYLDSHVPLLVKEKSTSHDDQKVPCASALKNGNLTLRLSNLVGLAVFMMIIFLYSLGILSQADPKPTRCATITEK